MADAYTVAGPAAQVLIKDAGATRAATTPVPSLGALGLVSLASLMAVLGMRRTRKPTERRAPTPLAPWAGSTPTGVAAGFFCRNVAQA